MYPGIQGHVSLIVCLFLALLLCPSLSVTHPILSSSRATLSGHIGIVELLLEKAADINLPNNEGWTPLIVAAGTGRLDLVELLVAKGAKVDSVTSDGDSALARYVS